MSASQSHRQISRVSGTRSRASSRKPPATLLLVDRTGIIADGSLGRLTEASAIVHEELLSDDAESLALRRQCRGNMEIQTVGRGVVQGPQARGLLAREIQLRRVLTPPDGRQGVEGSRHDGGPTRGPPSPCRWKRTGTPLPLRHGRNTQPGCFRSDAPPAVRTPGSPAVAVGHPRTTHPGTRCPPNSLLPSGLAFRIP